jgi:hypothetical protein
VVAGVVVFARTDDEDKTRWERMISDAQMPQRCIAVLSDFDKFSEIASRIFIERWMRHRFMSVEGI